MFHELGRIADFLADIVTGLRQLGLQVFVARGTSIIFDHGVVHAKLLGVRIKPICCQDTDPEKK